MKRIFTLTLALVALVVSTSSLSAQTKIGKINTTEIINLMPEKDSAQVKIEALAKDYQEQLEACQVEFNNKVEDYQKKLSTFTEAMKQQKEKELGELQARAQEMQQTAQKDIQNMQITLMAPIYELVEAAITKVSKAQSLTLTFDSQQASAAGLLYMDDSSVADITPMVKSELGL